MKIIYQRRWNDCAIACIKMVLDELNIKSDYDEIKKQLNKKKTLYDIRLVLNKYGVNAVSFYEKSKSLKTIEFSYTILNLKILFDRHFAILKKSEKAYFIYDPIFGKKKVKKPDQIYKRWTGYAVGISDIF